MVQKNQLTTELQNLFYLFPEKNCKLGLHEDYALFLPQSESWMEKYRYYNNARQEWSYPKTVSPQNFIQNREAIQTKPSTYGDTRGLTEIILKHFLSLYSSSSINYFDVGSYVGNFSIQTALLSKYEGIDIKIWAFEPSPIFKLLEQSIDINNVKQKIVLVESAISNVNGPIILNYTLGELIGADIGSQQRKRPSISQICNSTTIDSFVKSNINTPNSSSLIIKLDCQGFEYQVFEGCESILSQNIPLVFLSEFLCWSFKAKKDFYSKFFEKFHIVDVKSHMCLQNFTYLEPQKFPEYVEKLHETKQPWTDLVLIPKKLRKSEILVEEILRAKNKSSLVVPLKKTE
ncbi:MAG: FkbM family methyltransferase [Trichodesmium sp. MAG_R04]|nr:FkbM family methyltransferase [Trichodesmium sp. MAG_R04]